MIVYTPSSSYHFRIVFLLNIMALKVTGCFQRLRNNFLCRDDWIFSSFKIRFTATYSNPVESTLHATKVDPAVQTPLVLKRFYCKEPSTVSYEVYREVLKRSGELERELGEKETKLEFYCGVVAADLSRCVLEKFVTDVLEVHGFVKKQPTAKEIQAGFAKFLASSDPAAAEFKEFFPKHLESREIIESGTDAYIKLSGVIHRALDSFLDNNDVRNMYEVIEKAPRLTNNEKIIVDRVAKFLYSQKKK